jgi:uncharacterized protein YeaO (DUF488 family)
MFMIKRVYDAPAATDGYRILVDRLWPRGVSKQAAALDLWMKDIAPSPALRTWFGHHPERFAEFAAKYEQELQHNLSVRELAKLEEQHGNVTLLYAAHDPKYNHALVLQRYLTDRS